MRGGCILVVIVLLVLFFFASLATIPEHGVYGLIIPTIIGIILFNIFKPSTVSDDSNKFSDGTTITIHSTRSIDTHTSVIGQSSDSFGQLPLVVYEKVEDDNQVVFDEYGVNEIPLEDTIVPNNVYPENSIIDKKPVDFEDKQINDLYTETPVTSRNITSINSSLKPENQDNIKSNKNEARNLGSLKSEINGIIKHARSFYDECKDIEIDVNSDSIREAIDRFKVNNTAFSPADDKPIHELKTNSVFHLLVNEVQRDLNKELSPDELMRLFGIYDNLRMPPEVISLLVKHCISEHEIHSGGQLPTMQYIEKAAQKWVYDGVLSLDEAQEYKKQLETRKIKYRQFMNVLHIKNRGLTITEKQYIDGWLDLGFTAEVVKMVYTRTLEKAGSLELSYMDNVLRHWYSRKFLTLAKLDRYVDKTWDDMKNADDSDIDDDYDNDDGLHSISVR